MTAWMIVATALVASSAAMHVVSEEAAEAWHTVTRAFIAAPFSLVIMALLFALV
ncbi:MAG: hypothetical protein IT303_10265 [Dehalococcoidia bacterium]|nr:hypothetical protein [Dehalococcoidia bacterium]